ncbi:MAG: type II secretion system protein N [Desulfobacterales bacterium]|jgi:general secretion pathway protein C|nr:type II secretion system protein N [Desulfobacterales bacterium]
MIKIASHILNLLFITAAVYFAVNAGYNLLQLKTTMPSPISPAAWTASSETDTEKQPLLFYQPILKRNLFHTKGETDSKTTPEAKTVDIDKLEKTELRLKLWGTVASAGDTAYAVIESEKERKQSLYKVGDTVETATVKIILREKVILTVDGKDEVLEIQQPVDLPMANQRKTVASMAPASPFSNAVSKRRITMTRAQIESAMSNVAQLMSEAKIDPVSDGLMVTNVKPNSLFRRMGLRNGDIIVGVDGKAIGSVDDALKLYENLKTSDTASVEIKRRDRHQMIEYRIR